MSMINFVSIFGLSMLVVGIYTSWLAWFAFASRRWPTVRGRVLLIGVESADGDPPGYRPRIRYQYTVEGVTYESTRIRFGGTNPFDEYAARSELRPEFLAGKLDVYYDVRNPKRACVISGSNAFTLSFPILYTVLGMVALVAGALFIVGGLSCFRTRTRTGSAAIRVIAIEVEIPLSACV